jgi:hypothetical protein
MHNHTRKERDDKNEYRLLSIILENQHHNPLSDQELLHTGTSGNPDFDADFAKKALPGPDPAMELVRVFLAEIMAGLSEMRELVETK